MRAAAPPGDERAIFEASLELPTQERPAFIAECCADDTQLEKRVVRLVAADALGRDAGSHIVHRSPAIHDDCVSDCGPYRPVEKLGEGGMGVVYLAEQTYPVKRRVALKILKLGMDTKEVVARFESERQALALMDHRNIARILDAGASESGRPYFAMEYVPGEPIVDYCNRKRLSLRARLRLFVEVCFAIQHAHQKGIIHRDLKPSNILVMEEDGAPIPKIIDFGIAKAMSRDLTDRTLRTELGHIIGTPEYMSPEQADMSALDVDTRSDVYSLGVILHELVVGSLPFDFRGRRDLLEMLRIVREEEVHLPSRRVAGARRRWVKGELDWILLMALAKHPAERYPTARCFGEDIIHYLEHEPLHAGQPGVLGRLRKFFRRHRAMLGVTVIVVTALVAGLALASMGLFEARRERDAARAAQDESEAVTSFLAHMLSAASPAIRSKDITVRAVLDEASATVGKEFEDRPLLEARLRATMGNTYRVLGIYDEAEANLYGSAQILEQEYPRSHPRRLDVERDLVSVYRGQGRLREAEQLAVSLLERHRDTLGDDHPATVDAITELGLVYAAQGRDDEALELLELELSSSRRAFGDGDLRTLQAMHNLAHQYARHGMYQKAEPVRKQLLEATRRELGDRHPLTIVAFRGLASLYTHQSRFRDAERRYQESLALSRRALGPEHPYTLGIATSFAELLELQGKLAAAEHLLRQTVDAYGRALGPQHFETIRAANDLGRVLLARGERDTARALLARAVTVGGEVLDSDSTALARYRVDLARYHIEAGRSCAAEPLLRDAHRVLSGKDFIDRLSEEALASARVMLAGF